MQIASSGAPIGRDELVLVATIAGPQGFVISALRAARQRHCEMHPSDSD